MYAGTFKPTADGYSGRIRMFGINEAIIVVPAEPNDAENAPDYRVHLDEEAGPEIGAGWKRVGEKIGRAHSELQSLMRSSYAVFCLKKKKTKRRWRAQLDTTATVHHFGHPLIHTVTTH